MEDFIDSLKIGAIVTKRSGSIAGDRDGTCEKGEAAHLNFSDPDTHKKFIECIFSAVKGSQ